MNKKNFEIKSNSKKLFWSPICWNTKIKNPESLIRPTVFLNNLTKQFELSPGKFTNLDFEKRMDTLEHKLCTLESSFEKQLDEIKQLLLQI